MKNGLLIYQTNNKSNLFNIGDYIQSLAAMQFYNKKIDVYVNRENLNIYKGEKLKLIMNGWFMHEPKNWPPSNDIDPLFVAFHINKLAEKELLSSKSIDYFKQHEPIGCRDLNTMNMLQKCGVNAYFSGCLTLTLCNSYQSKIKDNSIYFTDPYFVVNKNLFSIIR